MTRSNSFETTYTRYPFAPLVALGVAIAAAFKSTGGKSKPATRGSASPINAGQHAAA